MKKLRTKHQTSFYINEKHYDDRVEVNENISLFEYGVIRNSRTGKTVYGVLGNSEGWKQFDWRNIDVEDVKTALDDIDEGFWVYIGADKQGEILSLNNNNLANWIHMINDYNGYFKSE